MLLCRTGRFISTKSCALCGNERPSRVMVEMGSGSGFYQCLRGQENSNCSFERLPAALKKRTYMEKDAEKKIQYEERKSFNTTSTLDFTTMFTSECVDDGNKEGSFGTRAVRDFAERRKRKTAKTVSWRTR